MRDQDQPAPVHHVGQGARRQPNEEQRQAARDGAEADVDERRVVRLDRMQQWQLTDEAFLPESGKTYKDFMARMEEERQNEDCREPFVQEQKQEEKQNAES